MNEFKFEEIQVGTSVSFNYVIDERKMKMFYEITEDGNPLHANIEYAKQKGFKENVVYGQLVAAALSTLAGMYLPGKYSLIHSIETLFLKPVFVSECPLKIEGIVESKDDRFKIITLKFKIFNIKNEKVCKGKMQVGLI